MTAVARIFARIGSGILLGCSIPIGFVAALIALVAVAQATGNRLLAIAAAMAALIATTGGLSLLAMRGATRSRRLRNWISGCVTCAMAAGFAAAAWLMLLAPAPAYSPLPVSENTRYWELPTGSRIAYTLAPAQGNRRPEPVILIHGGPGAPDGEQTELTAELTAAGFDVYNYDQVGAGLSERLNDIGEYTVGRHVDDLEAIRAAVGADRMVLIGGSWGGQLIANYLAAHGERVSQAIVSSPGNIWSPAFADRDLAESGRADQNAVFSAYPRFILAHALAQTVGPQTAYALLPDRQMDGVFQAIISRTGMWAGCGNEQQAQGRFPGGVPKGVGFWVNAMTGMDTERVADPRPSLRNVAAEVLLLRSECDYIAWEVTREYRDLLPNSVLLAIDDAGHTLSTDKPELYRQAVLHFLLRKPLPLEPYTAESPPFQES